MPKETTVITRTKTAIAAGIIAVSAFVAAPSYAGGIDFDLDGSGIEVDFGGGGFVIDFDHQMSAREVRRMLRHRGYHDIDFSDTDGRIYRLTAEKHGDDYFMKVDSYTGEIVHRHEI
jgi:hypothetical protein